MAIFNNNVLRETYTYPEHFERIKDANDRASHSLHCRCYSPANEMAQRPRKQEYKFAG